MNNRNSKLSVGLAFMFELILLFTLILNLASRQWKNVTLTLLAMMCIILPFILVHIANLKNIVLPISFSLVTVVFMILAQYLGEIWGFYQLFWWWDLFLHALFGGYTVIVALNLVKGIIRRENETSQQRFTLFTLSFGFCFTIAMGTLWEMFEFLGDFFLNTHMVKGGLEDTATDLLVKISAAFVTSLVYYCRVKYRDPSF